MSADRFQCRYHQDCVVITIPAHSILDGFLRCCKVFVTFRIGNILETQLICLNKEKPSLLNHILYGIHHSIVTELETAKFLTIESL